MGGGVDADAVPEREKGKQGKKNSKMGGEVFNATGGC
jgi:hypothetical protein